MICSLKKSTSIISGVYHVDKWFLWREPALPNLSADRGSGEMEFRDSQKYLGMKNEIPIPKFTLTEKLFAQLTYNAGVMVAAYGLYLNDTSLGIGYLIGAYTGIFLLVRYTICPRCPHLTIANDCVNLSASIMKKIVSFKRSGPLNTFEIGLFITVLYGTFFFPIYWLSSNHLFLMAFVLLYGGHLLSLKIHFCRKCSNKSCIQSSANPMRRRRCR